MSDYSYIAVPVGKNVQGMDISPKFGAYTGVEIVKSEDSGTETVIRSDTFSPETGRIFRISNPWGTKEQANNILARLQGGFQYQPYSATGAEVNPAAEIGDGISANNVYSGIYKMSKNFTSLMASDVSAPQDEEVNHEYPYEPKQERVYKREIYAMQSSIRQTAEQIRADVVKKVDGSGNGDEHFGWVLNSTSWSLVSGSATVFRADKSGVTINGIINAKSGGTIGGFNIGESSIYKTKATIDQAGTGVYIGTNGIALGDNFAVTNTGEVTAKKINISNGSIRIGDIQKDEVKSGMSGGSEFYLFQVTSGGTLRAKNIEVRGSIKLRTYDSGKKKWGWESVATADMVKGVSGGTQYVGATTGTNTDVGAQGFFKVQDLRVTNGLTFKGKAVYTSDIDNKTVLCVRG